jgi:hypothetical protein
VPEDERGRGLVDQMEVRPRGADRSLQLEDEPSLAASPTMPPGRAFHLAE